MPRAKRDKWERETVPYKMVGHLRARYGTDANPATRWFAVHMCRLALDAMPDPRSREALDVAERFLAGLAGASARAEAVSAANDARVEAHRDYTAFANDPGTARDAAGRALRWSNSLGAHVAYHALATGYYDGMITHARDALAFRGLAARASTAIRDDLCRILREVAENPFRPVAFRAEWRTDTVTALARRINEHADFATLPILADALQDAGCDAEPLLHHLRDARAAHLRGCWALELVLGRA